MSASRWSEIRYHGRSVGYFRITSDPLRDAAATIDLVARALLQSPHEDERREGESKRRAAKAIYRMATTDRAARRLFGPSVQMVSADIGEGDDAENIERLADSFRPFYPQLVRRPSKRGAKRGKRKAP